ncbi:general stress protein [Micrococcus luteus]|uniref:general stress protein n=1 Tax=Micrococcus luteus TaxID=1270 RepID=UPI00367F3A55
MSFMMSSPQPGAEQGLPRGELLATYATYAQAREQVDRLAATDFPVSAVSIVGKDLRVVERVRGRLNYAQVALSAGVRGVFFGGLIGVFLYLLAPEAGPGQILTSMLLGLAVWLIFGVIGFAMRRGQHGFASSQAVVPTAFDLVVAFDHAARARQELGLGGAAAPTPQPAPAPAPAAEEAEGGSVQATPAPAPSSGGSHAAPARPAAEADPAPTGLDRSYGVTLPPEEVAKLIEARGGHPPRPQDEPRG